ncbi:MAG TPA: outer membrane beta-barrel protein [Rhizomicrobium sp.]|jgi:opacity protein-like surface antigen
MRIEIRGFSFGLLLVFGASNAVASPQGWYLGTGVGLASAEAVKFGLSPPAGPESGVIDFNNTAAVNIDAGYRFQMPLRAEFEVRYADFSAKALQVPGLPAAAAGGDANAASMLGNLTYDIPLTDRFALTVGGGIGGSSFSAAISDAAGQSRGSEMAFTWQLIAGATARLHDQLELQLDYRYQITDVTDHDFGTFSTLALKDKDIQTVMLGLRWYVEAPR